MTSKTKQEAEAFDTICYAAFHTHFKTVLRSLIRPGEEPDEAAQRHWNENLPSIATLWHGLIKGVLVNVAVAQASGHLPALLASTPAQLPGLGGPIPQPDPATTPAGLATRIAGQMRAREAAARDTVPGLAVGRATGDADE